MSKSNGVTVFIPQESILWPIWYQLNTSDIAVFPNTTMTKFSDNTIIHSVAPTNNGSKTRLKDTLNSVLKWTKKWRIKLNASKSQHVDFINRNNL